MANKKNISSGAEKAEKLTTKKPEGKSTGKSAEKSTKRKTPVKSERSVEKRGKTSAKKSVKTEKKAKKASQKKISEKRAKRMEMRKQKKEERAKVKADKRQARLERKLAHKEKKLERVTAAREKREERRERRKERRDLLKKETKEARRKRIAEEKKAKREARAAKHKAYLAEKKAKREHALKVRAQKRADREQRQHSRTPGFGGWLAAVISLGVTTLALGTIVTFGWLNMDDMQAEMASGYTHSLYELNSVIDNLDADLARAKASSSASDRVRVLSDIAIESETAETILERLPADTQMTEQFSSFVNKMGDSAKQMLYTVANGGELTASQKKSLNYMYETNAKIKEELNSLISTCDGKDLLSAMKGKDSSFGASFEAIQNNTFEAPKGIQDGPFSDAVKKTNPKGLSGQKEITAATAEEMAMGYFADYKVSEANCTGETTAQSFTLYNINLTTPDGEVFVQLSKNGGKVVSFDSFKDCSDKNFSIDRCVDIAEDFLSKIGYSGVKAVWSSENGTTCNLNFAPVTGGTVLYPDLIKVKVCEERGIVTGVEALSYVLNHGERQLAKPTISEAAAQSSINGNIEVTASRKALIPFDGKEILCYEFFGMLDGNEYYVYVDAQTGEEVEVLTVIGTAQGKALM